MSVCKVCKKRYEKKALTLQWQTYGGCRPCLFQFIDDMATEDLASSLGNFTEWAAQRSEFAEIIDDFGLEDLDFFTPTGEFEPHI